jgi:hypothetical protein
MQKFFEGFKISGTQDKINAVLAQLESNFEFPTLKKDERNALKEAIKNTFKKVGSLSTNSIDNCINIYRDDQEDSELLARLSVIEAEQREKKCADLIALHIKVILMPWKTLYTENVDLLIRRINCISYEIKYPNTLKLAYNIIGCFMNTLEQKKAQSQYSKLFSREGKAILEILELIKEKSDSEAASIGIALFDYLTTEQSIAEFQTQVQGLIVTAGVRPT